ncbi:major facilitator superfamily domain-containing protein [Xylaria scruposa]|nr:major facilitator superfamily domain-containing protein [Xylaria scruposa]
MSNIEQCAPTTNTELEPPAVVSEEEEACRPSQGGLHGYFNVVGLFFVYFITLGQLSAFSTYQDYYEEKMLASYSPSTISWIGTSQVFLLGIVGLLSGALYDRGHTHVALIPGFVSIVLGLLLLSFSYQYWHVLLSQGFLVGIGGGLVYIPAISIVSLGFPTKSALALGIAATGSAIGGIIWPIVFQRLLPEIGFAWTNRVFALMVLILAIASYFTLTVSHPLNLKLLFHQTKDENEYGSESDTPVPKNKKRTVFLASLKGRAYQFLSLGIFFVLLGYWVPIFYLAPFASRSLNTSSARAADLLSILNAASLFGRVLPAALGHKIGAANILLAGATILGVLILSWISIQNVVGITVWVIFLGFTAGSVITIPNAVGSLLSNPSETGLRLGVMWAVGAFAELIGPPIAGALLTQHDGKVSYLGCQIFGGLSILVGAGFLVVPAWSIMRRDQAKKGERATGSLT